MTYSDNSTPQGRQPSAARPAETPGDHPRPADSDHCLVERARQGCRAAYAELANRYGPMAYRAALRVLGHHQDAEDIAQEALVAAWRQLPAFRSGSSFPTWLFRIVTNRALNRITRSRATDSLDKLGAVASSGGEPAREVERAMTTAAVTAAVAALPPLQRVAIVLHHFAGLSNAEVARLTASTVPAVRSHLFRGRRTLTRTLQDWQ